MSSCSRILAKQSNGENVPLFEGNNPLPFFWLMLLSEKDVLLFKQDLDQLINNKSEFIFFQLNKLDSLYLAANRRGYITKYLPLIVNLFDDWIYYLQISHFSDMKIYIDFFDVICNHSNKDQFFESLLKIINCFDNDQESWHEETIAGTCGYDCKKNGFKNFCDISKAYQELNKKDIYGRFQPQIHLHKKTSFLKKFLSKFLPFFNNK